MSTTRRPGTPGESVPSSGQPKRRGGNHGPYAKGGTGPRPADYAPPSDPVAMFIVSGGTTQRVERVMQVSHATGRVLITCYPDLTPRWVSLIKPRTVRP